MDLHEDRIAGAFGAGSGAKEKWRSQHSLVSWWERFRLDAVRSARCEASSFVLVQTAAKGDDVRLVGEYAICGIDPDSGAGEMSVWALPDCEQPGRVARWAAALVIRDAFTRMGLPWVVAPVAVDNPGPRQGLVDLGFEKAATMRDQRTYAGRPTDHVLWALRNTEESIGFMEGVGA